MPGQQNITNYIHVSASQDPYTRWIWQNGTLFNVIGSIL